MSATSEFFAPLRYARFRNLFIGQIIHRFGVRAAQLSAALLVYDQTHDASDLSLVVVVCVGSGIIANPLATWMCSVWQAATVGTVGAVVSAAGCLALAGAVAAENASLGIILALLLVISIASKWAIFAAGLLEPLSVPTSTQRTALGLASVASAAAVIVGALLGGILTALDIPAVALVVAAVLCPAIVPAVRRVAQPSVDRAAGHGIVRKFSSDMRESAKLIRESTRFRFAMLVFVTFYLFVAPIEWMMPVIVDDGRPGIQGLMLAIYAAGAMVTAIPASRLVGNSMDLARLAAILASAIGIAILAYSTELIVFGIGAFLLGMCWEAIWTITRVQMQLEFGEDRAVVLFGLIMTIIFVAPSIGSFVLGSLIDAFGLRAAQYVVAAAILIAFAIALWAWFTGPRPQEVARAHTDS